MKNCKTCIPGRIKRNWLRANLSKKSKGHPEIYDIMNLQVSIPTTPEHLADVLLGIKPRQPKKSK